MVWVTVSMRVMSAGAGYRYLLNSVAVGDAVREPGRGLADYYTVEGCPPGRWLGSGLPALGSGHLRAGDVVEEEQVARLLGQGRDPLSGEPLGRAYPQYRTRSERIADRVATLDPDLSGEARAAAVERIEREEGERRQRRAVAGFDLTFSVPKSVSVLWALSDPDTRTTILEAHHAAIGDVIQLVEREVAATRMGASGPDGAVAQVPVTGIIAAAFDHYDSRAGDPQVHTHVVIANKAQAVLDGRWRSLDGQPIHAAMVALSEHYNAILADRLTDTLGSVWRQRDRGPDRNLGWEIAGVPEELLDAFSTRTTGIETAVVDLIDDYVATHGHQPSPRTVIRLRQQATLATRPDKQFASLADLTERWRATADAVGMPATRWLQGVLAGRVQQRLRADDLSAATLSAIAATVVDAIGERRSTWRRWNLHAEATRQLMGVRFHSTADRNTILTQVIDAAEASSVPLTPPDLAPVPAELQRTDGTSVLRPRHTTVFTSAELLAAEDRLIALSRTTHAPQIPADTVIHHADGLGEDQVAAISNVATSGRVVDVLVGPAGAGKTTTMRALRAAWEHLYGTGSVLGLAPSAAAAEVLGTELDITADTTAKWLHDHHAGRAQFRAGQLVVVDEASLAGTHTLHRIATAAADAGAKVLLVGDSAQLAAVDAGGAFAMLVGDRDDVAELTSVRRFHHDWEKDASLRLRNGDPAVLDDYSQHGRLHGGDTDTMLDAAYTAWQTDLTAGRTSLLIAPTRDQVTALNTRAQTDRAAAGAVDLTTSAPLRDGTAAGIGDLIVTRRNRRQLTTTSGRWVRNGDRWTVDAVHPDGSLTVRAPGAGTVQLPAGYVADHVELGYAVTAHRAQGATVDTAHALITPGMTRNTVYVALTRGRQVNHAYTCTDTPDAELHQVENEPLSARDVLVAAISRSGAEQSAHATTRTEQDRLGSVAQLAAEYETIAAAAQRPRWTTLIHTCGLTTEQAEQVLTSDAFSALTAALRRADAHHLTPERLMPGLVADRDLDDADDIAAVLHHRVTAATTRASRTRQRPSHMVAGLIPKADGPMSDATRVALDEREQLILQRAKAVLQEAASSGASWLRHLGALPPWAAQRAPWTSELITIAAYRDRYAITADTPLGATPTSDAQRADAATAAAALERHRLRSPFTEREALHGQRRKMQPRGLTRP
ncbi:MobF family relaxase [Euzebya sp.]|uniref:MobF family relaxase n=1 Tax=Euzebya sp. TaxID=1971409 RepID=UPI0035137D7F